MLLRVTFSFSVLFPHTSKLASMSHVRVMQRWQKQRQRCRCISVHRPLSNIYIYWEGGGGRNGANVINIIQYTALSALSYWIMLRTRDTVTMWPVVD